MKIRSKDLQKNPHRRRKGDRRRDESERRLRAVVDAAPVPLFITRAEDGEILYANDKSDQLLGLPPGQALGRKAADFYVDPDRRQQLVAALEREGVVTDFPLKMRTFTGEQISILLSAHPIIYDDDLALLSTATNLTERALAEAALRESEERFRSAFEAAPHGFALVDPDGKFLKVNRALCEIVGYDETELLASDFQAITHPDDLKQDLAYLKQALAGEIATYQMEKRYLHKDGHAVWGLLSVTLVRDAEGKPLYFVGQVYDLTQRKETEAALQESTRRLEGILNYSPLLVSIKDVDGRYKRFSRRYEELMGETSAELAGKTIAERYPDDREGVAQTKREDRELLKTGRALEKYMTTRNYQGQERTTLVTKFLLRGPDGEPNEICGVGIDITERRAAEKALEESQRRLQGILDYSPIYITVKGVDGRYKVFNRHYEMGSGIKSEDVIGKTTIERFRDSPELLATLKREDKELLRTGKAKQNYETSRTLKGEERYFLTTKFPLEGEDGKPNEIISMAMDITERKRAEEAFKESHRQLQGILDYAPMGISLKDTAGTYKWVNRHYETMCDISGEALIGKKADDGYGMNAAGAAMAEDSARTDRELLRTGEPLRQQNFTFRRGDQNRIFQRTKFLILDEHGTPSEICSIVHDVTDRVKIEEALRENEEQFRLILESVGEGIYGLDLEGRGTFVNPAVAEMTGFALDELIGQTLHLLIHHSHPDGTPYPIDECPMYAAFTDGTPHHMKDEVLWRKDGTSFPIEYTSTPLRKGGKLVGAVVTFNDVTKRRAAEAALEESQLRLQGILDSSPMLISVKGHDGRYKIANRHYEVLSGIKGADMIGKTATERFPDNPELATRTETEDAEVFATGKAKQGYETTRIFKGEERYFLTTKAPLMGPDGKPDEIVAVGMDITERKRAEEALKESHLQLQGILNFAPLCVSLKDLEGRYKWINRYYEETFGVRAEDMVGKTAMEAYANGPLTSQVRKQTYEADRQVIDSPEPIYEQGFAQTLPDGKLHYFQRTKFTLRDSEGNPTEICSITADITQSAEMERALRESEARFRNIAERAPVAISINRISDGKFLYANPAVAAFYGVATGKLGAQKSQNFYQDPMQRAGVMKRLRSEGHIHDLEIALKKADGTPIAAIVSLTRITFDGEDAVMNVVHDVTQIKEAEAALRESETRFRAVVEGSPLPLIIARVSDGRIAFANSHAGPALGLAEDALVGRHTQEFYQDPAERDAIKAVIQEAGDVHGYELKMKKVDGTLMTTLISVHLVTYEGEPCLLSGFQDITAFKEAEEQLRQATKMEAIGQLTGGIAHDFNNLLGVIIGNLELLDERSTDETTHNFARRALGAADRGATLTQRLLAFSRKQTLEPVATDLNRLVSGMMELFEYSLSKTVEIETHLAKDLRPTMIDPNQLESVILNLSLNAQDAMPSGGRLTLTTENVDADALDLTDEERVSDRYVLLTVRDTGIGIPKENLARVFDPFFTTKGVGKGSGLGLSVVYGFIRQSGGLIRIESKLSEGTAIQIYLPTADEDAETAEDALPELQELEGNGEMILLVEDDVEMRSLAKRMLTGLNYRVIEAGDAFAALELLESTPGIDLLFTDVILPKGLNGVELARKARKRHEGLRVLLTSGYLGEFPTAVDPSDLGADLVEKPYRKQVLAKKIRETLAAAA